MALEGLGFMGGGWCRVKVVQLPDDVVIGSSSSCVASFLGGLCVGIEELKLSYPTTPYVMEALALGVCPHLHKLSIDSYKGVSPVVCHDLASTMTSGHLQSLQELKLTLEGSGLIPIAQALQVGAYVNLTNLDITRSRLTFPDCQALALALMSGEGGQAEIVIIPAYSSSTYSNSSVVGSLSMVNH